MKIQLVIAACILCTLTCRIAHSQPLGASTCMAKVPASIKTMEGKEFYVRNYTGCNIDGFGTTLPDGLGAKEVISLIAPNNDPAIATLVGVRAWPYRKNSFVAIACFALNKEDYQREIKAGKKQDCGTSYDAGRNKIVEKPVYIGLIEYKAGELKAKTIASHEGPLALSQSINDADLWGEFSEYNKFDFAPYKISDTDTAIGIRFGAHHSYKGGGEYTEFLALFMIDEDKLLNVLSEPVYNISGELSREGAGVNVRYESRGVLSVSKNKTSGFYDLVIKSSIINTNTTTKHVFTWSNEAKKYQLSTWHG